jgi:hypothetical protein
MNPLKRLISHGAIDSGEVRHDLATRKSLLELGQIGDAGPEEISARHRRLLRATGDTDGLVTCRAQGFEQPAAHKPGATCDGYFHP